MIPVSLFMFISQLWNLPLNGQATQATAEIRDYCDTEEFNARCGEGEVILMTSARYGRMDVGRCVEHHLGSINCSGDVLGVVDARCSGRQSCTIRVPDKEMEAYNPCMKELKTYLSVGFICAKVEVMPEKVSCSKPQFFYVNSSHGYIRGSFPASKEPISRCIGKEAGPTWTIVASPGERIHVNLVDFSFLQLKPHLQPPSHKTEHTPTYLAGLCKESYGFIREEGLSRPFVICGGQKRAGHVYTSRSHVIQIQPKSTNSSNFLLEYEVVGCANPVLPENTQFRRTDDGDAEITCDASTSNNAIWLLKCDNKTWTGSTGNCSESFKLLAADQNQKVEEENVSYGVAALIVIGAACGIGLTILVAGIIRYRRPYGKNCSERQPLSQRLADDYELRPTPTTAPSPRRRQGPLPPIPDPLSSSCESELLKKKSLGDPANFHIASSTPNSNATAASRVNLIRINGSEYEHIWETPLPTPEKQQGKSRADKTRVSSSPSSKGEEGKESSKAAYVSVKDICRGEKAHLQLAKDPTCTTYRCLSHGERRTEPSKPI